MLLLLLSTDAFVDVFLNERGGSGVDDDAAAPGRRTTFFGLRLFDPVATNDTAGVEAGVVDCCSSSILSITSAVSVMISAGGGGGGVGGE